MARLAINLRVMHGPLCTVCLIGRGMACGICVCFSLAVLQLIASTSSLAHPVIGVAYYGTQLTLVSCEVLGERRDALDPSFIASGVMVQRVSERWRGRSGQCARGGGRGAGRQAGMLPHHVSMNGSLASHIHVVLLPACASPYRYCGLV